VQIPPQPDETNPLFRTINITHPLKEQAEMTKYYIAGVLSKNTEVMQQLGLASNTGLYGSSGNADYSVQVQVIPFSSCFALFCVFLFLYVIGGDYSEMILERIRKVKHILSIIWFDVCYCLLRGNFVTQQYSTSHLG